MQLPETHTLPQPPQLKGSWTVSVQVWSQFSIWVFGPPSLQTQVPPAPAGAAQCWLPAQMVPQTPQLLSSLVVLTQDRPASVVHSAMVEVCSQVHTPRRHCSPSGQTVPQLPQLRGSL